MLPALQEVRYTAHDRILSAIGRPWRAEAAALWLLTPDNPLIVDVGANRGFSIAGFRMMSPAARIVAFEPLPHLACKLRRRFADNAEIEIIDCALGRADDRLAMHVPIYRGFIFDGLASLDRDQAEGWFTEDRFYWLDRSKLAIETADVPVRRLDDYGLDPFLLKIYVQGLEREVLVGAEATLKRAQPLVLTAARMPKTTEMLADLGYVRLAFHRGRFHAAREADYFDWYMTGAHLERYRDLIAG